MYVKTYISYKQEACTNIHIYLYMPPNYNIYIIFSINTYIYSSTYNACMCVRFVSPFLCNPVSYSFTIYLKYIYVSIHIYTILQKGSIIMYMFSHIKQVGRRFFFALPLYVQRTISNICMLPTYIYIILQLSCIQGSTI